MVLLFLVVISCFCLVWEDSLISLICWDVFAGVPEWPKGSGLGPDGLVLRGFEPHPPHQSSYPPLFYFSFLHRDTPSCLSRNRIPAFWHPALLRWCGLLN